MFRTVSYLRLSHSCYNFNETLQKMSLALRLLQMLMLRSREKPLSLHKIVILRTAIGQLRLDIATSHPFLLQISLHCACNRNNRFSKDISFFKFYHLILTK